MIFNKLAILLAAFLLLNVTQVFAEDSMPPEHKMDADTNKDGKISRDEFRAAHEKRSDAMFKRMDTNGDGFIDQNEKKAAGEKMHERREHRREMHEKAGTDTPK